MGVSKTKRVTTPAPKRIINNRYEIIKKLGAGGIGEAYKVKDLQENSILAIKLLSKEIAKDEDTLYFNREFYTISKLSHPNIVKVYDYGTTDDGRIFFTMEYLDGENIKDFFSYKPYSKLELDYDLLYPIILQISDVLSYIHSQGLVHSDIKPENIIILKENNTPKLLDFSLTGPINIGTPKAIRGTLNYVAPEIIKGIQFDQRSDLYSLGVLLYEVVTGIKPFQGKDPITIIRQHIEKKVSTPRRYNKGIPKDLEKAILKLMEKAPEDRYFSAEQLINDITKISGTVKRVSRKRYLLKGKFVGREGNLTKLKNLYEKTKKNEGSIALIGGEAGIGKSRLIQELQFHAQMDGAKCIATRCYRGEDTLYKPFVDLVYGVVECLESNNLDLIKQYGSGLLKLMPELRKKEYMGRVEPLPELPPKAEKIRLFDYVTRFLIDASRSIGPIVLIVEDLHSARKDSVELLEYLVRNIKGSKLLICGTYRSEEVIPALKIKDTARMAVPLRQPKEELHPLLAIIQADVKNIYQINLRRLNLKDTNAFISSMLGMVQFEEEFIRRIFGITAGNPLFIEEIMEGLVADGVLTYEDEQWAVNFHILSGIKIPNKIEQIVRARLTRLSENTLRILSTAAVIGKEFRLDMLRELDKLGDEKLFEAIEGGVKTAVITERRIGEKMLYDFTHPLIRELLYKAVKPLMRKLLHQKIGELLERYNADKIEAVAEQLAYHYSQGANKIKAVRYLSIAGDKARQSYSNDEAIKYYEDALHLMSEIKEDGERSTLLEKLGDVYELTGSYDTALDRYEHSLSLVLEQRDLIKVAELYRKIGNIYERMGKYDDAIKSHESGVAMIATVERTAELPRLYERMGRVYYLKGKYEKAIELCERSIDIAEKGSFSGELASAFNRLGDIYRSRGEHNVAMDYLKRSLGIQEKIGNPYDLVSSYNNLGILYKNTGEWYKAIEYYDKALEIANRIGDIDGQAMLRNNLGVVYKNTSQWSEAEQCYRQSAEIWERTGSMGNVASSLDNVGVLLQRRGELKKAKECYKKSLKIAKNLKYTREIALLYEHLGELYLEEMNLDESLKYLRDSLNIFQRLEVKSEEAVVRILLGELHLNNKEYDDALKLCQSALDIASKNNLRLEEANTRRVLGKIYGIIGEIKKAKENFAKGIVTLEELRAKYELGRILLDTGYWLLDKKLEEIEISGIKGSLSFLNRAKEIFEEIGAKMELGKTLDAISRKERVSLGLPERADRLVSLYRISQIVNSVLDLDQLLSKIMDIVNTELKAERGLILLMDDKTNELNPIVARNLEKETIKDATRISSSVIDKVLKGGKPVISSDVASDPRFDQSKSVILYNIRSLMSVPLIIKSKVIGAIYVDSRVASHIFDEEDLRFLSAFANVAAVAIDNARLHSRLTQEYKTLKEQVKEGYRFEGIIGISEEMQKVYTLIDKVTKVDIPVLILGETGTGKELVARTIHYNSRRREGQFIPINCSAIPEELLESELFGYVRGAFTEAARDKPGLFEEADQGTVFLDEIGDMSPKLQAKLLRVLENGEVRRLGDTRNRRIDVRIISASNKELKKETQLGKFREDLYYRINVVTINLPPLRDRKEDIPLLTSNFLNKFAEKEKKDIKGFAAGAMRLFTSYNWPGNVRELKNEIERAVALSTRNIIAVDVLSDKIKSGRKLPKTPAGKADLKETMNGVEKRFIRETLESCNWNQTEAAKVLGLSRQALIKKIKKYKL